jgi:hypothetical protein
VASVITVQSPNFGSPLARAENRTAVATGVLQTAASVAGFDKDLSPNLHGAIAEPVTDASSEKLLKHLCDRILLGGLKDCKKNLEDADSRGHASEAKAWRGRLDTLASARKWLSGLHGDDAYAFPDLSPTRLNEAGTVLGCLYRYPHGTERDLFYGAVVGANPRLRPVVTAGVSAIPVLGALVNAGGYNVDRFFDDAESIIQDVVMSEKERPVALPDLPADSPAPKYDAVERYQHALIGGSYGLRTRAGHVGGYVGMKTHDFVIPAAYQLMLPHRGKTLETQRTFFGNLVDEQANHISGAARDDLPVRVLLGDMAEMFPRDPNVQ